MLNNFITNYFGFNKQQRNGLLVLMCLSLMLLIIRIVYPMFIVPDPIVIENFETIQARIDSAPRPSRWTSEKNDVIPRKYFVFDPNTVTREQLIALGFKEKNAGIFIKYRSKGFVFREKSDLKKVFGVSDRLYMQLEPYILIRDIKHSTPAKPAKTQTTVGQDKLELNSADSAALEKLNGIGPAFSKRILKYRQMLGGFTDVAQLKEVYGFTEELFEKVRDHVTVDASGIRKINLNKDDFKTINKHPYLSYELTKKIFDWRRKTIINSTNLQELLGDENLYRKLSPYLTFD